MNPAKAELKTAPLETRWFETLALLVRDQRSIDLRGYKRGYVMRRISARMRATGCSDLSEYTRHLRKEPHELDLLIHAFAINISSFFRNPEVFDEIVKFVFEAWRQKPKRTYRAWSCACAHGEEPYSLSMLWQEWQQRARFDSELKIVAGDVDTGALADAERAEFPERALQAIPERLRGLVHQQNGVFQMSGEIKRRVQFVHENALSPASHLRFDLILCRNFLIFLDSVQQEKMFEVLHRSLAASGFLVLGGAESIRGPHRSAFRCIDAPGRIYQKLT